MATPRTVAGRAALSGMRPHVKRALAQMIVSIETEAAAPYLDALREADAILAGLAALAAGETEDGTRLGELSRRAERVRVSTGALIAGPTPPG